MRLLPISLLLTYLTAPLAVANDAELRARYMPAWAAVPALRQLRIDSDPALSDAANGARLNQAIEALIAGDRLVVGPGVWSIEGLFFIDLIGTAAAPIRIEGEPGSVLTRSNAGQNAVNIGPNGGGGTEYLLLSGFEVRGGSYGIRVWSVRDLWIDRCHVHHVGGVGIGVNSADTDRLHITRCEIHDTDGIGEGIYLGANHAQHVSRGAVIAQNHVHHTGGSQGDGIEIKQGSSGCLVAENVVHDTPYPGILLYGTGGGPQNEVDANVIWNTGTNPFQIQGEAIVTNNLVFARHGPAFQSGPHQGDPTRLVVVGNTFVADTGRAGFLRSWAHRPGMVLANNAFYAREGTALWVNGGMDGVAIGGNVNFGFTFGLPPGSYSGGVGLGDFVDVAWDGSRRDARPALGSALDSGWSPTAYAPVDLTGAVRPPLGTPSGSPRVGALQPGTYGRYLGPRVDGAPRLRLRAPLAAAGTSPWAVQLEGGGAHRLGFVGLAWAEEPLPAVSPGNVGGLSALAVAPRLVLMGTTDATGRLVVAWPASVLPALAGDQVDLTGAVFDRSAPAGRRAARRMRVTFE